MSITCLIADDHPLMASALRTILGEHDIDVVAEAGDGEEALRLLVSCKPTVALVDVRMPLMNGVDVVRQASERGLLTKIILYTAVADQKLMVAAIDAGAGGFLLKEAPASDVVRAVEQVAAGRPYVDPSLAAIFSGAKGSLHGLTDRERQVLLLLADGLTNEEIGQRLHLSSETIRTHVRKLMRKLGAETRAQAVAIALRAALIS